MKASQIQFLQSVIRKLIANAHQQVAEYKANAALMKLAKDAVSEAVYKSARTNCFKEIEYATGLIAKLVDVQKTLTGDLREAREFEAEMDTAMATLCKELQELISAATRPGFAAAMWPFPTSESMSKTA